METTDRACYLCGATENPIVATEAVEHRFGRPLIPEGIYRFARCRHCSTLYVDSDVSQEYLDQIYEPESEESISEATGGITHDWMISLRLPEFEHHWNEMKKQRPPAPGDQLLDLGCHTGEMGSVAARDGVIPNGIELSRQYAAHCRRTWGGPSRVHCGSVFEAPFERGEFQYISAYEVLEHMCDPARALLQMREWLAPDGLLAVSMPSSDYFHFKYWLLRDSPVARITRSVFAHYSVFYRRQILPHSHIFNFSHASMRLLLERGGFETVAVGLTGWHGRAGALLNPLGRLLEWTSNSKLGIAPSLFAMARPLAIGQKESAPLETRVAAAAH
jgi:2-polyprenyl-3-methyl-5-hydroxy-6-metoxy-1,4-benzoquinol methylase